MLKRVFIFSAILLPTLALSQIPEHVQVENEEPDWTNPWNIIVLFGIPLFMIIFSLIWRARLRAKAAEKIDG